LSLEVLEKSWGIYCSVLVAGLDVWNAKIISLGLDLETYVLGLGLGLGNEGQVFSLGFGF